MKLLPISDYWFYSLRVETGGSDDEFEEQVEDGDDVREKFVLWSVGARRAGVEHQAQLVQQLPVHERSAERLFYILLKHRQELLEILLLSELQDVNLRTSAMCYIQRGGTIPIYERTTLIYKRTTLIYERITLIHTFIFTMGGQLLKFRSTNIENCNIEMWNCAFF